ncbi:YhgE/Pip domain-containing protein [Cohnella faecalis]|uniref:DUF3533 domain-containing protein n=1 Tax=Cohnella faecalis TaxID=2315694 RepID=A0A398CMY5_9BACL|nr:ABC transporter permease [Cohnella faecalis]RIE00941.1 DUF3533 domain-containing protein [Cohnella faecalis]
MNTVRLFFKRPTTWIGLATALMFQVIFSVVWMTGYDGVSDRMGNLKVGIVNEDPGFGAKIVEQLRTTLPVQTEVFADSQSAEHALNERELQMVIRIPAAFSADVATPDKKAELEYLLNESNPATIKSMMTGVSSQVTAAVNKIAVAQGVQGALSTANVPADQAANSASALSERVVSNLVTTNKVNGMNNQMVPMMLVLASYVGAMIMGMNMEQSSMALAGQAGRWQRFAARGIINLGASVVVSLVGATLVSAFGGGAEQGFGTLWLLLFLIMLTFLFVSQLFLLLLGMGGMLLNIVTLSAQLVSSGAMVPRELLSGFYRGLGDALPATFAVEGTMNVMFGGPGIGHAATGLLIIAGAALALGALAVAAKRGRAPQAIPSAAGSR